ncbi:hypothetical protein Avbf_14965 [Armadillidium vulgare]|nr:hypothetical protein Avbf_14965 [Armadillidium vulgare]
MTKRPSSTYLDLLFELLADNKDVCNHFDEFTLTFCSTLLATEAGCFTVNRIQGQVPLTESRSLLYC